MSQWISPSQAWAHVAFFERELAQRKIFSKLIEGLIPAWAEHYTLDGEERWDAPVPQEFWDITWSRLDFTTGNATRAVFDPFASINEAGERVIKQHSRDTATGIRIDRDALLNFWPPVQSLQQA